MARSEAAKEQKAAKRPGAGSTQNGNGDGLALRHGAGLYAAKRKRKAGSFLVSLPKSDVGRIVSEAAGG